MGIKHIPGGRLCWAWWHLMVHGVYEQIVASWLNSRISISNSCWCEQLYVSIYEEVTLMLLALKLDQLILKTLKEEWRKMSGEKMNDCMKICGFWWFVLINIILFAGERRIQFYWTVRSAELFATRPQSWIKSNRPTWSLYLRRMGLGWAALLVT